MKIEKKKLKDNELKEIIQSGNLNFLIGSGCSSTFLDTLNNLEKEMDDKDDNIRVQAKRKYFKILVKSKAITDNSLEDGDELKKLNSARNNYETFLTLLAKILVDRKLNIINKQVNIFTTNFDLFLEDTCEKLNLFYNDGFDGRIRPVFDVANFNKLLSFKSLQFDNKTDIPLFNIIKIHGSISWQYDDSNQSTIVYAKNWQYLDEVSNAPDFETKYDEKVPLINPNLSKHTKTVLDVKYGALLRKLSLELEKENSVLFVIGFSFNDIHIKELVYSVAKSNPTLIIIYFSYDKYDESEDILEEKTYQNLYIIDYDDSLENEKGLLSFENSISYIEEKIYKKECISNISSLNTEDNISDNLQF